ncbi:hypothetical protein NIES22_47840 [Calothrix brevissima NIES-22]|nr:hypothetical protein NIES22_47840 [Calothrix brevissima NIES-22]
MRHFNRLIIVVGISLMALVGCNKAEKSATQTSPSENSSPEAVAKTNTKTDSEKANTSTTKTEFDGLLGVITNTKVAVEARNFAKAKEEFGKFEDFWSKVEDGVKSKSPSAYKEIEDKSDELKAALKTAAPNKEKVLAALQSLNKNISSVAKS